MSTKNFMSYGDAETVLTGFANTIKGKQDKYVTITYAQWLTLTPEQRVAKDYYISDYPASMLTAGNIAYDNTTSGMAANEVQGAIDELKSGLTNLVKSCDYTFDGGIPAGVSNRTIPKAVLPMRAKCLSVRAPYAVAGMLNVFYSFVESSSGFILLTNNAGAAISVDITIHIDYI